VARIIRGGRTHDAVAAFRSHYRIAELARTAELQWARCDALCLPTAPEHPTLAAVAADPLGVNARLGRFTNFANLLDTCAAAVPSGFTPHGLPTGVTLFAPAWHDLLTARLGAALQDALALPTGFIGERLRGPQHIDGDDGGLDLAVFGAHLSGQPLNHQLTVLGGRLRGAIRTAPVYRLHALPTTPPKPGLVRGGTGGIAGELWRLPTAAFASFVAAIPAPLGIGKIELDDGRQVCGFLAEAAACSGTPDISTYGSWPAWLARAP
jgi:allophanate hydrolase